MLGHISDFCNKWKGLDFDLEDNWGKKKKSCSIVYKSVFLARDGLLRGFFVLQFFKKSF